MLPYNQENDKNDFLSFSQWHETHNAKDGELLEVDRFLCNLRKSLRDQGLKSIVNLGRKLKTFQNPLNLRDFKQILFKDIKLFSLATKLKEMHKTTTLNGLEFFHLIKGENMNCKKVIIHHIFKKLDRDKKGYLTPQKIVETYDPSKDPQVITGKMTVQDTLALFLETFDVGEIQEGRVYLQEWENYFTTVAFFMDNDHSFELLMKNVWLHLPNDDGYKIQPIQENFYDVQHPTKHPTKTKKSCCNSKSLTSSSSSSSSKSSIEKTCSQSSSLSSSITNPKRSSPIGLGTKATSPLTTPLPITPPITLPTTPPTTPLPITPSTMKPLSLLVSSSSSSIQGIKKLDVFISSIFHRIRKSFQRKQQDLVRLVNLSRRFQKQPETLLNFIQFKKILEKSQLGLLESEMQLLFDSFDKNNLNNPNNPNNPNNNNHLISWKEFMNTLHSPFSEKRYRLVQQLFHQQMDQDEMIHPSNLLANYDASQHPEVLAGKRTEYEVYREFLDTFDVGEHHEGKITFHEWETYFAHLSLTIEKDQDFLNIMKKTWHWHDNSDKTFHFLTTSSTRIPTTLVDSWKKNPNQMNQPGVDAEIVVLLQRLRSTLKQQGCRGIIHLSRKFRCLDQEKTNTSNLLEFRKSIHSISIDFTLSEIRALFTFLDQNQSGSIDYIQFLTYLKGSMNETRNVLAWQTFQKLDPSQKGYLNPKDLVDRYDASKHPDVIDGKMTTQEAFLEFLDTFHLGKHGQVTWKDWETYYTNLSFTIECDKYFQFILQNTWNLSFTSYHDKYQYSAASPISTNLLQKSIEQQTSISTSKKKQSLTKQTFLDTTRTLVAGTAGAEGDQGVEEDQGTSGTSGTSGTETKGTGTGVEKETETCTGSIPGSNIPGSTTPGLNIPGSNIPGSNIPGSNIPGSNIPGSNIPGLNIPDSNIPGSTTPGSNIPGSNIPGSNIPGSNIPDSTTPGSTTPGSTTPGSITPGSNIPGSNIPGSNIPGSIPGSTPNPGILLTPVSLPSPTPTPPFWNSSFPTLCNNDFLFHDTSQSNERKQKEVFANLTSTTCKSSTIMKKTRTNNYSETASFLGRLHEMEGKTHFFCNDLKNKNHFNDSTPIHPTATTNATTTNELSETTTILNRMDALAILSFVRNCLKERGMEGIVQFIQTLNLVVQDQGKISLTDFKKAIHESQFSLVDSKILMLYSLFDQEHKGYIHLEEFSSALRGSLNEKQKLLVNSTFQKLEWRSKNKLTPSFIVESFVSHQHPDVVSKKRTPDSVFHEFLDTFNVEGYDKITLKVWENYCTNLSFTCENDDVFEDMIQNLWDIKKTQREVFTMTKQNTVHKKTSKKTKQKTTKKTKQKTIKKPITKPITKPIKNTIKKPINKLMNNKDFLFVDSDLRLSCTKGDCLSQATSSDSKSNEAFEWMSYHNPLFKMKEILHTLRYYLGSKGLQELENHFISVDANGSGFLDMVDFVNCLVHKKINLSQAQLEIVYHHYKKTTWNQASLDDDDDDGDDDDVASVKKTTTISSASLNVHNNNNSSDPTCHRLFNYNALIFDLRGEISETRKKLVHLVLKVLYKKKKILSLEDILKVFDANQHPFVIYGCQDQESIVKNLLDSLETRDQGVNKETVLKYFNNLSMDVAEDYFFNRIVCNTFHKCLTFHQ